MATVTSNLGTIVARLRRLAAVGSLNDSGRYGPLWRDVQTVVTQGLIDRYVNAQQEPSGRPLAALAESTLRSKRLRGYPDTIGVATGEMLSQKELEGTPAVSPVDNTVTLTYGTKETTRQKMERFTRGRRRRGTQPPRPGYELDATIEADLNRLIVDVIERRLSHLGGA